MKYSAEELAPFVSELTQSGLSGPVEPFLVFADWLQSRGDPWGELIAIQCQRTTDEQQKKKLELAGFGILQRIADTLCPRHHEVGITWRRGFVDVIAFGDIYDPKWFADELDRLFSSPATELCAELSFAGTHLDDNYVQTILRFKSRLARIAKLDFGTTWFSESVAAALRLVFPQARLVNQAGDHAVNRGVLVKSWDERGDD